MPTDSKYGDYIASEEYREYYEKYFSQLRESDRLLVEMLNNIVQEQHEQLRLVDIGCGSGNLLFHIRHTFPTMDLTGGDVYPAVIDQDRQNPDLQGISFEVMDLLHLFPQSRFDVVVANAVLFLFDEQEFDQAIGNIAQTLKPGGWLISFDFANPYPQDLVIFEKTRSHPDGMYLHFRPDTVVRETLASHGFSDIETAPFEISIDLSDVGHREDMVSRTIKAEDGTRLIFRGSLFTPWCHIRARKSK